MKKIISLVLTAVMLVSAMGTLVFAEDAVVTEDAVVAENETVAIDAVVEDAVSTADAELYASVKEQAGLVKTLGIMLNITEENIKAEIPRGEFVEHVLRFAGYAPAKSSGLKQYFLDVPEDSEYYDAVTTAAMVGLIHGDGRGYFLPEQNIKYNEAIKMIVGALDYGAVAEARGGYPMGYLAVANDLKILKNINLGGYKNINNANAIKLVFNALNANAAEVMVSSDNIVTMNSTGVLHLEKTFHVEKFKGIVTGTQVTRQLEGKEYIGWVEIDSKPYRVVASEYFNEEELLGMSVYYYVYYEDYVSGNRTDGEIIMISPMDDRNTVIKVIDEDIKDATSVSKFVYWTGNAREITKDISNATIYYNGRNCAGNLAANGSDLRPENGNVTLIDNDRDGQIDFVIVENYVEYVVDYGATTKIVTKYGSGEITIGNRDDIIIIRDGVVITADFLGEWESIKVMEAKNNGGMYIRVSGDTINGVIARVDNEEIKFGDTVYKYADVYKDALAKKHHQAFTDKKGATVTIAVNEDNEVIGMTSTVTEVTEYGYMVKAVDKGGLDTSSQIKIFCMYGTMSIFDCAENIKINGRKIDGGVGAYFTTGSVFHDQLIRYTKKGDKVTAIYTANDNTNGEEKKYGPADNENFAMNYKRTSGNWQFASGANVLESTDAGAYVITTSFIPTFWIPEDRTQDDLYKFYETASSINGLEKTKTELYVYDAVLLENNYNVFTPGALVVKDTVEKQGISESNPYILSSISNGEKYYVVDTVEVTVDGAGDEVYQITSVDGTIIGFESKVYNVDKLTSLYGYGNLTLGDLDNGDIIQVGYGNDAAKANRFVIIAKAEDYSDEKQDHKYWSNDRSDNTADIFTGPGTANAMLTGEIIYENHPTYIVRTQNKNGENEFLMLGYSAAYPTTTGTVYVYERGSQSAFIATSQQLAAGKRVMMHIRNNGYMGAFIIMVTD